MPAFRTPDFCWGPDNNKAMVFWLDGPIAPDGFKFASCEERLMYDDPAWKGKAGIGTPILVEVPETGFADFSLIGHMTTDLELELL